MRRGKGVGGVGTIGGEVEDVGMSDGIASGEVISCAEDIGGEAVIGGGVQEGSVGMCDVREFEDQESENHVNTAASSTAAAATAAATIDVL